MKITCIAGSGMGGTEKAAYLYACSMAKRGHIVEALANSVGCWQDMLIHAGVSIRKVNQSVDGLVEYFSAFRPDIVHNHTSGYSDQSILYKALDKLESHRPKIVETNVFGQLLDHHDQGYVDFRVFVSFTSGMQAFRRIRVVRSGPSCKRHNVIFNPLANDSFETDDEARLKLRQFLGINPSDILVIRIGRPGSKWEAWECEAFQEARKHNPTLKLLLMEPKISLVKNITKGIYGEGIFIKKADSDPAVLKQVYSAGDIMFQASSFGESFGYTLAEGMAAGMPVISLSTPWGDQAQTELIDHGKTGYICRSIKAMSRALVELSLDPHLRSTFGKAGQERIRNISSLEQETSVLEEIYSSLIDACSTPEADQRFQDWKKFIQERSNTRIACYERDNGMKVSMLSCDAYDAYRYSKHLIKFILMRLRGKLVFPPDKIYH